MTSKNQTTYLKRPIDFGIDVDPNCLEKIIKIFERNYKNYEDPILWSCELSDEADELSYEILKKLKNICNSENVGFLLDISYPKEDSRSIHWHILYLLEEANFKHLDLTDLQHLKKFLKTPKGKELEGWAEWEAYWEKREAARAKKKK